MDDATFWVSRARMWLDQFEATEAFLTDLERRGGSDPALAARLDWLRRQWATCLTIAGALAGNPVGPDVIAILEPTTP